MMDNNKVVRRMNEADEKYRDPIIEKFPNLRPEAADWLADFVYDKVAEASTAALAQEVAAPADPFAELATYGCPVCDGNGTRTVYSITDMTKPAVSRKETCRTCNGHGVLYCRPR